ncbi:uncharacterized protein K452DRAFT_127689 [Aplosporella prunicola CBS 121167]|uniref:Uncharacterized protein n=1 Tax=Aplosporella prunicola CBS 121167 TaxID=1176127 RepID=A0A6A6B087_9PEZI|nr:uncharacterized protein K452DRAFT_127689 [Aplosporella prunicola CBS 121167]KAF2136635.1 hypothetical protein K452DRAFT_127689 [Aplosporella prunicola CBS 121167]
MYLRKAHALREVFALCAVLAPPSRTLILAAHALRATLALRAALAHPGASGASKPPRTPPRLQAARASPSNSYLSNNPRAFEQPIRIYNPRAPMLSSCPCATLVLNSPRTYRRALSVHVKANADISIYNCKYPPSKTSPSSMSPRASHISLIQTATHPSFAHLEATTEELTTKNQIHIPMAGNRSIQEQARQWAAVRLLQSSTLDSAFVVVWCSITDRATSQRRATRPRTVHITRACHGGDDLCLKL